MKLGILKEPEGEMRVPIVPNSIPKLIKSGLEVIVENGVATSRITRILSMRVEKDCNKGRRSQM